MDFVRKIYASRCARRSDRCRILGSGRQGRHPVRAHGELPKDDRRAVEPPGQAVTGCEFVKNIGKRALMVRPVAGTKSARERLRDRLRCGATWDGGRPCRAVRHHHPAFGTGQDQELEARQVRKPIQNLRKTKRRAAPETNLPE